MGRGVDVGPGIQKDGDESLLSSIGRHMETRITPRGNARIHDGFLAELFDEASDGHDVSAPTTGVN